MIERLHGKPDKREEVVNFFVADHKQCTKKAVRGFAVQLWGGERMSVMIEHAKMLAAIEVCRGLLTERSSPFCRAFTWGLLRYTCAGDRTYAQ